MKKELTILITILFILSLTTVIGAASEDIKIGRTFAVGGVGSINSNLEIATQPHWKGIEFSESISTPGGGFIQPSKIQFYSTVKVNMYNVTGNDLNEVKYHSTIKTLNINQNVNIKNYDLGALMGVKTHGGNEQETAFYSGDSTMVGEIGGNVSGSLKVFQKVVDVQDKHTVLIDDEINLKGDYVYEWSAFAEKYIYSVDDSGEWLGCP